MNETIQKFVYYFISGLIVDNRSYKIVLNSLRSVTLSSYYTDFIHSRWAEKKI